MCQVLIIDQSPAFRQSLAALLEALGVRVIEAADGLEAQSKFQENLPHAVITDTTVPSLNGYQFCHWLKSHPTWRHIPVIFCSNRGSDFDRAWGLKKGANAYVVKSSVKQELPPILLSLLPFTHVA